MAPVPHEVVQLESGIAVSNYRSAAITRIETAADTAPQRLDTAPRPHGLAVDTRGVLWYTSVDGAIHTLNGETGGAVIPVGDTPHAIEIDPVRDRAYVAVARDAAIVVVDLRTQRIVGLAPVDALPEAIALSADGRSLAVPAADGHSLTVLDTATLEPRLTVALPGRPVRAAFAGAWILVSLQDQGRVAMIDRVTGALRALIPVGPLPDGIAVDDAQQFAYIAVTGADQIAILDLGRMAVTGTLPAGAGPSGLRWVAQPSW